MNFQQITQVFGVLAVMILVIFAAYYATRFLAVKSKGMGGKTRNFRLIDRFSIARDKEFILIAAGQTVYLIGVTNQNMTVIDKKEASEFPAEDERTKKPLGVLPDIFSAFLKTKQYEAAEDEKSFSEIMRDAGQAEDESGEE
ncbi:MAG: FliO/MopB family protein [Oscillospiraceae bacterium]